MAIFSGGEVRKSQSPTLTLNSEIFWIFGKKLGQLGLAFHSPMYMGDFSD